MSEGRQGFPGAKRGVRLAIPSPCLPCQTAISLELARLSEIAAYTDLGPGYICTDKAFEEGGYEPTDTAVGPGSEPLLKAAILKLLGAK